MSAGMIPGHPSLTAEGFYSALITEQDEMAQQLSCGSAALHLLTKDVALAALALQRRGSTASRDQTKQRNCRWQGPQAPLMGSTRRACVSCCAAADALPHVLRSASSLNV